MKKISLVLVLVLLVAGCASVPMAGKHGEEIPHSGNKYLVLPGQAEIPSLEKIIAVTLPDGRQVEMILKDGKYYAGEIHTHLLNYVTAYNGIVQKWNEIVDACGDELPGIERMEEIDIEELKN